MSFAIRMHYGGLVFKQGGEAFIVTARDMIEAEKKTFHRKAQ